MATPSSTATSPSAAARGERTGPSGPSEPTRPAPGSGAMFDRIAERYDLMNRLISLGTDRIWRRRAVGALNVEPGGRYLDLATGTADVALQILAGEPETRVIGIDPSTEMLAVGRRKASEAGLDDRIELQEGVAEELPLGDGSVDGAIIAFGIRNVPDRDAGLAEMVRVVRRGGRVVILELSEPRRGLLAPFARLHVHWIVPRLGALLSGAPEYAYLSRSIAAFPPPEEFAARMETAGLGDVRAEPQTFGVCHLFSGIVR